MIICYECVFPWITQIQSKNCRFRCCRKFPEGTVRMRNYSYLVAHTICGFDLIMEVPFLRTNRIKRTFINYDDFHWIIIANKFCCSDSTTGILLYIETKWFKTDRSYTRTEFRIFKHPSIWMSGIGVLANTPKNKAAKIKVMDDYQCKFSSKSPQPRDARTNMQIYTIPHEILTSNMDMKVSEWVSILYIIF